MRSTIRTLAGGFLCAMALPGAAYAKKDITPYLEVAQIVAVDVDDGADVLTYSSVAAGIDAAIANKRTRAQINYRYERRFSWDDKSSDGDVHTGLARAAFEAVPGTLAVEAGALATRARIDVRGSAPGLLIGNPDNVTQVYSAFAGPSFTKTVGALDVSAAYRLGYTKVESNDVIVLPGQPRLDNFNDSKQHLATASVGMASGVLPFGWTVSARYRREDAGQLDQRFESKSVRGDVVVPVSPTVALVGGLGYEDIEASQRAPLLAPGGVPVVNGNGRFVTDPASPRLLAYDQDGLYWDVGVLWRPSRRTELEVRAGERYESFSFTGSFNYQMSRTTAFGVVVYDQLQTFGQLLNDNLALLPTSFTADNNALNPQFGGCVFGSGGGAGGCLNPAFQSINSSVFRTRGVTGVMSYERGPWNAGIGLGYAQRTYKTPVVPGSSFTLNGVRDESWFVQGQLGYQIDPASTIDASVFASLYDSGILGAANVLSTGATGSYQHVFGRRVSGIASVGLFSNRIDGFEGDLTASALLGMRVSF
jgi:hypothetical protein